MRYKKCTQYEILPNCLVTIQKLKQNRHTNTKKKQKQKKRENKHCGNAFAFYYAHKIHNTYSANAHCNVFAYNHFSVQC